MTPLKKIAILLLCIATWACSNKVPTGDTTQNSVDWPGSYVGVLPNNVSTKLLLQPNLRYVLEENGNKTDGKFSWDKKGQVIHLKNTDHSFFVGENYIRLMESHSPNDKYTLHKVNDSDITEKYFKLVELNGKPVVVKEGQREPHMILKAEENKVTGNGGCNSFFGTYTYDAQLMKITFSQMGSTMMACTDENVESEFLKALADVNNYNFDGENLVLNKNRMAPRARFKVVYMK